MALDIAVCRSDDDSKLIDRCFAAAEKLAKSRLQFKFPSITRLGKTAFCICSTPFAWNIHPLSIDDDSQMGIQIPAMSIERIIRRWLEDDGTWFISIRADRIDFDSGRWVRVEFAFLHRDFCVSGSLIDCDLHILSS